MTATLSDDMEEFANAQVQSGEYSSVTEVIRAGLHLLEDRDTLRQIKLERLRKEIAISIEAADRGEVAPLDVKEIIAENRKRLKGTSDDRRTD